MPKYLFENNAASKLAVGINTSDVTLQLNSGSGTKFPVPSGGDAYNVTLVRSDSAKEIVRVTARVGDNLTVVRGQGGFVPLAFVVGDVVSMRLTQAIFEAFTQKPAAPVIANLPSFDADGNFADTGHKDYDIPFRAIADGTVDAITAVPAPPVPALNEGTICIVRAAGANTIVAPTFAPSGLAAKAIVRLGNNALIAGDIFGAGHELFLQYNSTNENWELLNPTITGSAMLESTDGSEAVTSDTIRAGAVDQTAVGDAAIGQGELKTTTASGSISVEPNADGTYALAGHTYSWWTASGTSSDTVLMAWGGVNTAAGVIGVFNDYDSGNRSFYVDERFIQSSPPWDSFGLGEVCLFVYILLNRTTGEIEGTQISPEPIWAYHGPTIITPHGTDKAGNKYRRVQSFPYRLKEALADRAKMEEYKAALATPVYENKIIDQDYKNADMDIIPHPFGNITANQQVVILEPTGLLCDQLGMMHDAGENIRDDILLAKYVNITRTVIDAPRVPAGVLLVRASLKYE